MTVFPANWTARTRVVGWRELAELAGGWRERGKWRERAGEGGGEGWREARGLAGGWRERAGRWRRWRRGGG